MHVYTSPHLVRFHERIELAGADGKAAPIGEADAGRRADAHAGASTAATTSPIRDHDGGGLPGLRRASGRRRCSWRSASAAGSTPPTSSRARRSTVITPISLDHADKLGATLAKIAREKAGILKRGVPAVISQQPDEALDVIRARGQSRCGAPLIVWGEDYDAFEQRGRLVLQSEERLLDLPLPALIGPHQIVNAGTADRRGAAAEVDLAVTDASAIERGLARRALAGAHAAARQRSAVVAC